MCGLPTWLEVSIERDGGPSYRVSLSGMALEYHAAPDGDFSTTTAERVRPRKDDWREFLTALEAAQLFQWAPEYTGEPTTPATRWSIELGQHYRNFTTSGENAYPAADAFAKFCAAMRGLLGGRDFA